MFLVIEVLFANKKKNMKSYLILICFVLINSLSQYGFSQESTLPAQIVWGEDIKEPSGTYLSDVITLGDDGIFAIRRGSKNGLSGVEELILERYSSKMNLRKANKLKLKYKSKKLAFEDMLYWKGNLHLLTSFNNKKTKMNYLFVESISTKSLNQRGNIKMIAEIPGRSTTNIGSFDYSFSRDSSKLLIYNELPYKKNDPERFAFTVYNDQFEVIWEQDISLPYPDGKFTVEDYRIDNNGNVFLLGVLYQDGSRRRRKGKPNYKYVILSYDGTGNNQKEFQIDLKDKFITDLTFRPNNKGHLICSGFYSEKNSYSVKGTYYLKIDTETNAVLAQNSKAFEFEFLTEHLSDRKKNKAKRAALEGDAKSGAELYEFDLDKLILRSDGGALLVAEQYYVYERSFDNFGTFNNPYGRSRIDYYYNYNDIIVVNIQPTGEIEWVTRIPKKQNTVNDGGYYSSYAMSIVRDKLFFVFNDNEKNFNGEQGKIYNFNGKNSIIALAEIRKDGTSKIHPLANNKDLGIIARPKRCKQSAKKQMVLYGERGRNFKFANLYFN